jgi:hypothetical protein
MKTILAALSGAAAGPSVAAATICSPLAPCRSPRTTDRRPITNRGSATGRTCRFMHADSRPVPFHRFLSRLCGLACVLLLLLTGCRSIGPATMPRDRSGYSDALSESWKSQTLLNIVKLRYLEPPIFVDVGQIIAGYSLETGASASGQLSKTGAGDQFAAVGGHVLFTDRPTITYTPLTGNKFVRGLMTPLAPESVFFTIQSGWPADGVMFAALAEINGLKNQAASIHGISPPDPEFLQVLALMRKLQLSGGVGMRIKQDTQKQQKNILTFRTRNATPQTLADSGELRRLLGLDKDATEINLVFGPTATNDKEVAVQTRSMMQQMATMASQVDVPAQDVSQGSATPGWETVANDTNAVRLIQIRSSQSRPPHAFVSVHYRGHWFWIDDWDLKSKRVFSFMMMLFTLADTGEKENLPLITIPAQ